MNRDGRNAEIADLIARLTVLMTAQPAVEVPTQRSMPTRVLLTVEEAAERLGIGKTKAYELVKSGDLESVLIGRLRRVHVDSIDRYAARLVAEQTSTQPAA
ncbi:excisionase family DNA binding protein [Saccharothrix ecbatanensis]|uniref:Excisionase family DNA binding protein n=1 Tax=Saccharothrix ecbatanensis TaxID=1105145 RepID=A0A7W9HRD9_9PSEU|nr:helix-turn-helix domain-containing protein [Saccharothrix ecbatanensis]MBB5807048.1 excisionase family DNA binding protein [Saccharothrix ecbatanensis]